MIYEWMLLIVYDRYRIMLLQRKYGYGQMNFHNKKSWNELQLNVIILDCDEDDCDDDDDDCDDNDDVDGDTQCGVCVCVW